MGPTSPTWGADSPAESLCGVWVDDSGGVRTTVATLGGKREERRDSLRPFAWLSGSGEIAAAAGVAIESLKGEGAYRQLAQAETLADYDEFLRHARGEAGIDAIRPLEGQYLLQSRVRLYRNLSFGQLRRCQLDIETASSGDRFSDAAQPDDRVLA